MPKFKMGNLVKPNTRQVTSSPREKLLTSLYHQRDAFEVIVNLGQTEYRAMVGCFSKKIRPWWFKEPGGPYGFRVYYGNRVLDIDGQSDVVVGENLEDIPAAIDWLIDQVRKGAFDHALTRVVTELSDRQKRQSA